MNDKFTRVQVKRLLSKYPNLYPRGFCDEPNPDDDGSLLDDRYREQIDAAGVYIRAVWRPVKHVQERGSGSYGFKHLAEAWLSKAGIHKDGVCTGALIAAALLLGYRIERVAGPNVRFNVTRRAVPRLR